MNELGKLVPFMNETDRNTALSLYEKLIDEAPDEQAALMKLVSPTRQAVNIARTYDAAKRKEAVEALKDGQTETICPEFAQMIIKIGCGITGNPDFPSDRYVPEPVEETASTEETETVYELEKKVFSEEPETENTADEPEIKEDPILDADSVERDIRNIISKTRDIYEEEEKETVNAVTEEKIQEKLPETEIEVKEIKTEAETNAQQEERLSPEKEQQIDDFIKSISVEDDMAYSASAYSESGDDSVMDLLAFANGEEVQEDVKEKPEKRERNKTKNGKLILFILCAVPVCALAVFLLLILSAASFAFAFAIGKIAILGIASAFGSYAVFADVLAVIGTSVVILALSIMFTWIGIWIIAGLIVGLVKKVFSLAGKWCSKEESAE